MRPLNTYPIEEFLDKAKIAIRTNQKNLTLTQKEVSDLANSITMLMARLIGSEDTTTQAKEPVNIKMDGGRF